MALKGNAAFLVDGPSGEQVYLCNVPPRIVSTRTLQRRYAEESLSRTTRNVVTIGAPVYELTLRARFADRPHDLLSLLDAAANGYSITYIHDLTQPGAGTTFSLIHGDDAIEATPDPDRYGYGEYDTTLVLRSSTSFAPLLASSSVLFRYHAGGAMDTLTFSRASTAYRITRGGVLESVASDMLRTEWLDLDGDGVRETPVTLVEPTRTPGWTYTDALDDAAWLTTRASVTPAAAVAPNGTTTAVKLVEDTSASTTHYIWRDVPVSATDDTDQTAPFFARAAERTWIRVWTRGRDDVSRVGYVNLSSGETSGVDSGLILRVEPVRDGWYRIEPTFPLGSGAGSPIVAAQLASDAPATSYTGDGVSGVYLWGWGFEVDAPFATSHMSRADTLGARLRDALTAPWAHRTQAMAFYGRMIYRGARTTGSSMVAAISTDAPYTWVYRSSGGALAIRHHDGASQVEASLPAYLTTADIGTPVEWLGIIDADGVQLYASKDGAAADNASQAGALNLGAAYDDPTLALGAAPDGQFAGGAVGYRDIVVLRGSDWTLSDVRRLLP